jgi:hypothetical protein
MTKKHFFEVSELLEHFHACSEYLDFLTKQENPRILALTRVF